MTEQRTYGAESGSAIAARRSRRRVWLLGWTAIVLLVGATLEVSSFVFLSRQRQEHGRAFYFDIDRYVASLDPEALRIRQRAAELQHIWAPDRELGWRRTPLSRHFFAESGTTINSDSMGARVIPNAEGPPWIATYGDSFTEGLEVDDADTWQAQLAYASGSRILNYGVSAYGPDQALLALEANLERGIRTPVVILAMINENLNRMMNSFRLFYTYPTEDVFLGFKPIFLPVDTGFEARSFAPADLTDLEALRTALWTASTHDWFYQHRIEQRRFPFSLNAMRFVARRGISPAPDWPDYSTGLPRARIEYIIRRFHRASRTWGFTPVFVLLPESAADLRSRNGRDHPLFSAVTGQPGLDGLVYIDVVKELTGNQRERYAADLTPESYIRITHPSAQGARAIASVLVEKLGSRGAGGVIAAPRNARPISRLP